MLTAHLSFRHFSRPSRAFFRQFYATFKPSLQASNRCILVIFLSATFSPSRAFSALFSVAFYPFSVNFYVAFKIACMLLINAYCPPFFPSLFHALLALFSALFSVAFYPLFPSIFTSHLNLTLQMFLINAYCPSFFPSLFHSSRAFSVFFPSLCIPFPVLCSLLLCLSLHDSNKCILPIFLSALSSPSLAFSPFFRRI
jgi:hypothetical protein